jgi:hypothetical protein
VNIHLKIRRIHDPHFRKLPLAVALAALFGLSGAAIAQGQPPAGQEGAPPQGHPGGMDQQQGAQIDPQTLDAFVDAFVAVQHIREDFAERLQGGSERPRPRPCSRRPRKR